jgi:Phosphoribosylaminoimidazole (AIR) synthetase
LNDLYLKRGVSSQKEDVEAAIKGLSRGLYDNTFCKILPDFAAGSDEHCCIMHADTAGTKSVIAYMYWKLTGDLSVWKGIAQDAMVMNIDDMICSGATDQFILSSTIARNKHLIPGEVLHAVIQGCNELIESWRKVGIHIHHAGGETADVGDVVRTIDVGYTVFTRFKKTNVIRVNPLPSDVIVGFCSYGQTIYEEQHNSGIGCNGLTSARHDLLNKSHKTLFPETMDPSLADEVTYIGPYALTDSICDGQNIGQLLLSPTRTYAPVIKKILESHREQIRGIIHNTGGGQTKCLKYLQAPLHIIKDDLWEIPTVFQLIQASGKVRDEEMYQVYNMGTRMELYTDKETAEHIIQIAKEFSMDAKVIGKFEPSDRKKLSIRIGEKMITY